MIQRILGARPDSSARKPDILFMARENLHRLTEDRLAGPADLIVEVVSTDSIKRDQEEKLLEYQNDGVREYWIVDPRLRKKQACFYHLTEAGQYELFGAETEDRVASHVLPGFWLRPA